MFELPIKFYVGCFFLLCAWFTKEKLPSGVYYYFLEYKKNGVLKTMKGFLYLENNQ